MFAIGVIEGHQDAAALRSRFFGPRYSVWSAKYKPVSCRRL